MPNLYTIWLQKDGQVCLLLNNQPLSDAHLDDPTADRAKCTAQFLEAVTEVVNMKRHYVRSSTAAGNAVGSQTSASSASHTWPVRVAPSGFSHAVGREWEDMIRTSAMASERISRYP